MEENQFGKGALRSPLDARDHQWGAIAQGIAPFDWNKGFDITQKMGRDFITKNQGSSGSCGGQAWSYYGEALEELNDSTYEPRSAKFIYAQTFVPGGGSDGRTNCKLVTNQGWAQENLCTSYDNGNPPDESFMERVGDITEEARNNAKIDQAANYAQIGTANIDGIAQAIQINNGCILGINAENNGTWLSTYPKSGGSSWAHWLYAGKAIMIDGKKYIGVKNSWGNVGDNGWQYLDESFFPAQIFEVWTIYFKDKVEAKKQQIMTQEISLLQKVINLLKQLLSRS